MLLADEVTRRLSLTWQTRERGRGRRPSRELTAVPPALIEEFSHRSSAIDTAARQAADRYAVEHGQAPSGPTMNRIRQHITLATRDRKEHGNLADATTAWQDRARQILQQDPSSWAASVTAKASKARPRTITAVDLSLADTAAIGAMVATAVASARSTWNR